MQVIIQEQETIHAMSMIWQVMFMNGQQRLVALPAVLASVGEAITTIPAATRAVASSLALLAATATSASGHFYICRTEL